MKRRTREKDCTCPGCGYTRREFRDNRLLGCPRCYAVFADALLGEVGGEAGRIIHRGKFPPGYRRAEERVGEMRRLEGGMRSAVRDEKVEDVRDLARRMDVL